MKKILLLCVVGICINHAFAQDVRINFYFAYVFNDRVYSYYDEYSGYEGMIEGGYQWGAGLEFFTKSAYSVELLYLRHDTHAPMTYQLGIANPVEFEDLELDVNYVMLAGNRKMSYSSGKFEGYAGFMLGVGILNIRNETLQESNKITKFAWGARIGGNIWVTEMIGIKVQAQLLSIIQGAGGSAYFGTSGSGVSSYSSIYQFSLGGGLAIRMGGVDSTAK